MCGRKHSRVRYARYAPAARWPSRRTAGRERPGRPCCPRCARGPLTLRASPVGMCAHHVWNGLAKRTLVKVKLFQDSSNLVINTAEGKGDMLVNGRSLKGLFATVADLEDDVNAMTTVGRPTGRACACLGERARARRQCDAGARHTTKTSACLQVCRGDSSSALGDGSVSTHARPCAVPSGSNRFAAPARPRPPRGAWAPALRVCRR